MDDVLPSGQVLSLLLAQKIDLVQNAECGLLQRIELAENHEICRQMGFKFGQGFYYGYPVLPKRLIAGEVIGEPSNCCDNALQQSRTSN